jgi:hypothetical protein
MIAVPPADLAAASVDLDFTITAENGAVADQDSVFRGPER